MQVGNLTIPASIDLIVSLVTIVFLVGYVFFSALVIKQVNVMCSVVDRNANHLLKILALAQFVAGTAVLVVSLLKIFKV